MEGSNGWEKNAGNIDSFPAIGLCFDGPNGALIDGVLDACCALIGASNDSGLAIIGHLEYVRACLGAKPAADAKIFVYFRHVRFPPSLSSELA